MVIPEAAETGEAGIVHTIRRAVLIDAAVGLEVGPDLGTVVAAAVLVVAAEVAVVVAADLVVAVDLGEDAP